MCPPLIPTISQSPPRVKNASTSPPPSPKPSILQSFFSGSKSFDRLSRGGQKKEERGEKKKKKKGTHRSLRGNQISASGDTWFRKWSTWKNGRSRTCERSLALHESGEHVPTPLSPWWAIGFKVPDIKHNQARPNANWVKQKNSPVFVEKNGTHRGKGDSSTMIVWESWGGGEGERLRRRKKKYFREEKRNPR